MVPLILSKRGKLLGWGNNKMALAQIGMKDRRGNQGHPEQALQRESRSSQLPCFFLPTYPHLALLSQVVSLPASREENTQAPLARPADHNASSSSESKEAP